MLTFLDLIKSIYTSFSFFIFILCISIFGGISEYSTNKNKKGFKYLIINIIGSGFTGLITSLILKSTGLFSDQLIYALSGISGYSYTFAINILTSIYVKIMKIQFKITKEDDTDTTF